MCAHMQPRPGSRGGHALFLRYFRRFIGPYFPEARWASGPQEPKGWLVFDCASMAQNAFCENQFDHFASERRAERRNAVLPSREPLRYSESSLRRRCLTTSTVSTCALDRAAGEAMLQTRAQSAVLVGLKRFTTLLVRPGAFAAAGRASWASSHSCKFLGRRPLAGSRPGNEPIPTDVRVRSPAAIVPAHRSTWGVIRGVLMACLQVCRSPCLIQTARPCHDRVLTRCGVHSQVVRAPPVRAAACARHAVRARLPQRGNCAQRMVSERTRLPRCLSASLCVRCPSTATHTTAPHHG